MAAQSYKTVEREAEIEFTVNRSRFIGYCFPVQTEAAALDGAGLTPYLLQYIHKQKTSPATFVLIEARKGAHAKPSVAEPIALYGPERFFTLESLAFCPFLR